ncbi:MAG: glycine cleavage system protein GcvH [Planctomycetota bacterium]|nr:glycine cleavage system protein GcvH [Planctomycetota bacterium]
MPDMSDCRFTDSHEWFHVEGDIVTIGISQYAANELTDITYVEMKGVGESIEPGDNAGEVESVKTTADVFCPFGGEVIEVNDALTDEPGKVNTDPFGEGWLSKIRTADVSPSETLMDADTYQDKYPV